MLYLADSEAGFQGLVLVPGYSLEMGKVELEFTLETSMKHHSIPVMKTPYYFIDERKLLRNLRRIERLRRISGAKVLLALKCFAAWSVFDLLRRYLDGTTSSSLYEARLGHECFGKETHAYCVGYTDDDIASIKRYADKVIFNSCSQLKRFHRMVSSIPIGLRVNPGISNSDFPLADPARRYSRLCVVSIKEIEESLPLLSGLMFHFNCENDDSTLLDMSLDYLGQTYGWLLRRVEWVSLGGGISFTNKEYPLDRLAEQLRKFADRFGIQVYLEPGEAVISDAAYLATTVVDIVHNELDVAIVDASTEAHMLDVLTYQLSARIERAGNGRYSYLIAGRSCLAGDIFGMHQFESPLKVGRTLHIADAAGYSMVKKNWFNGLAMPSIVVKRLNGTIEVIRQFGYREYKASLS